MGFPVPGSQLPTQEEGVWGDGPGSVPCLPCSEETEPYTEFLICYVAKTA